MKVLITGGSRGIGEACVRAFCKRGDRVAFFYHTSHERAQALAEQTGATAICADVSNAEQATAATQKAIQMLGGIDVLVNNAGIAQSKLFTDITNEDWRKMIDTNLSGAFYTSREASRAMVAQHFGRIINIGSMWGKTGASCEVHYSVTKAGIDGMTKSLAKELGQSNIRVNSIAPGIILTDMCSDYTEEEIKDIKEQIPLGKFGETIDIARCVKWLIEDEYTTGQVISPNGGWVI